jgi:hypothetical protein
MFVRQDQVPQNLFFRLLVLNAASFVADLIVFIACAVVMGLVIGRPDPKTNLGDQFGALVLFYGGCSLFGGWSARQLEASSSA